MFRTIVGKVTEEHRIRDRKTAVSAAQPNARAPMAGAAKAAGPGRERRLRGKSSI